MLKSMTAHGRATHTSILGAWEIEITSVNRKQLDIKIELPQELAVFEAEVRTFLATHISRGNVFVKIQISWSHNKAPFRLKLNEAIFDSLVAVHREAEARAKTQIALDWIMRERSIFHEEALAVDLAPYRKSIEEALQKALLPFLSMKSREGIFLQNDIEKRLKIIIDALDAVAVLAPAGPKYHQARLAALLEKTLPGELHDERLKRELILLVDRHEITEEIIRLRSHLEQLSILLSGDEPHVGRSFEFLLQEILREWNTIGSKSQDAEIAHLVVLAKTEIERLREQIQNVE